MMPNLFNERLKMSQEIVLEKGLSALTQGALLDMITRPVVRRGVGPEVLREKLASTMPTFRRFISFSCDEPEDDEEESDLYPREVHYP